MVFKLMMMLAAFMSGVATESCPCDLPEYRELVALTGERVVEHGEFRVPIDFFHLTRRYGCALVVFEIAEDGTAKDIKTVVSHPTRAIAASAKLALDGYRFERSSPLSGERGALIFEAIAEDD